MNGLFNPSRLRMSSVDTPPRVFTPGGVTTQFWLIFDSTTLVRTLNSVEVPIAAYLVWFIVTIWFWKTKKTDRDSGYGKQGYGEGKVFDTPLRLATKDTHFAS